MRDSEASPVGRVIEVRVADTAQLFDAMDPSPSDEKDLHPAVHEFIVGWARQLHHKAEYTIRIHITRRDTLSGAADMIPKAIQHHFEVQRDVTRRQLRRLFQLGRRSLAIGVVFLIMTLTAGEMVQSMAGDSQAVRLIGESLTIGGWVAMWRPLEIFLYDWWPIRADIRLNDALSRAPVDVVRQGS